MPAITACALVGVLVGFWVPLLPSAAPWPVLMVLAGIPVWWLAGARGLFLLMGFAVSSLVSHWYLDYMLPAALVRKDIVLHGYVTDSPVVAGTTRGFHFRVTSSSAGPLLRNVYLRVYGAEPVQLAGECWRLLVRLKRPYSTVNPGVRDREVGALAKRIHASGYVRDGPLNRRIAGSCHTRLTQPRWRLSARLADALPGSPVDGLIQGVTVGVRSGIAPATWRVLRNTGTAHLMAISGLHIGLVALGLWWPGRILGWLLNCAFGAIKPFTVARLTAIAGALGYAALAGFSVATLRASSMLAIALLLGAAARRKSAAGILSGALLIALLLDPGIVLASGFWLSYLAVILLVLLVGRLAQDNNQQTNGWYALSVRRSKLAVHTQLLLSFGLALPCWLLFGQVSLLSPLANLLAVPLFSFLILPPALLALPALFISAELATALFGWSAAVLEPLMQLLGIIAAMGGAVWYPADSNMPGLILALAGIVLCLLPRPLPGRLAGGPVLLVAALLANWSSPVPLRIHILDVGQGQAVLLRTGKHNILYDSGPAWPGNDAGQTTVLPFLRSLGITQLDALLISHDDADHSGGAASIVAGIPVQVILTSGNKRFGSQPHWNCLAPLSWSWGQLSVRVLHPAARYAGSDNDRSCVLLVNVGDTAVLLPGDIEVGGEQELLARAEPGRAGLVLGPHHGSRTSSSDAFVAALRARYVVFSTGYANRWQFPDAGVAERWRGSGSCVLTTAAVGAITFVVTDGGVLQLEELARSSIRRPWALRTAVEGLCNGTINAG